MNLRGSAIVKILKAKLNSFWSDSFFLNVRSLKLCICNVIIDIGSMQGWKKPTHCILCTVFLCVSVLKLCVGFIHVSTIVHRDAIVLPPMTLQSSCNPSTPRLSKECILKLLCCLYFCFLSDLVWAETHFNIGWISPFRLIVFFYICILLTWMKTHLVDVNFFCIEFNFLLSNVFVSYITSQIQFFLLLNVYTYLTFYIQQTQFIFINQCFLSLCFIYPF